MKTLKNVIEEEATRRFSNVDDHVVTEDEIKRDTFIAGSEWALANQWISVKDELPKPGEEVLLFEKNSIRPYEIGWIREKQENHKSIWVLQNGCVVFEVTHWMRIPKLEINQENSHIK